MQAIAPTAGAILLVPQAIIPAVMKLAGSVTPSWFVALRLADAWLWPAIALMFALGLSVVVSAAYTYFTYRARLVERVDGADQAHDGVPRGPS